MFSLRREITSYILAFSSAFVFPQGLLAPIEINLESNKPILLTSRGFA